MGSLFSFDGSVTNFERSGRLPWVVGGGFLLWLRCYVLPLGFFVTPTASLKNDSGGGSL